MTEKTAADLAALAAQTEAGFAAMKLKFAGPLGDHCTYSVFYEQLLVFGLNEEHAPVVSGGGAVAEAKLYMAHAVKGKLIAAMTPTFQKVFVVWWPVGPHSVNDAHFSKSVVWWSVEPHSV